MDVFEPQNMNRALADAYNTGEVDELLALYEDDAMLAPQPGERAVGKTEIETALSELLELGGTMRSVNQLCMEFEDLAHLRAEWTIEGAESDSGPIEVGGTSTEIVRRQPDSRWLYIIDHPFGSDQ